MKNNLYELIYASLKQLKIKEAPAFTVEVPRQKEFGDFASNVAIVLAKKEKQKPLLLANDIAEKIKKQKNSKILRKIEVAPPGFINFTLADEFLQDHLKDIITLDQDFGKSSKKKEKILLEYVSANPTGPLHVGHGRWAVIGDVLSRLLKAAGYSVTTEFYVNDVGNQIKLLEQSVKARKEGGKVPEGGYGGKYISEIAKSPDPLKTLLDQQKETLKELGIEFNNWFFESSLHKSNKVKAAVEKMHDLGKTFEEEGALWFKSQEHGDDKNRVLIKEDGSPTYFAADIAYHHDKFGRGFDHLIDIWGADHHGYVKRLKAAVAALGHDPEKLEIIIGQLVTLYRGKEPVRMSKRTGEMVTLEEVIDDVGPDATRFFFSMIDVNSHLDFDLELAKQRSNDNPVYYVQYAHARICSIDRKTNEKGLAAEEADLSTLKHPAERELMRKLLDFPDEIETACRLRQPHRLTEYARELATIFHNFYHQCRVIGDPARSLLTKATRITLRNVLELLGINAPERM